MLQACNLKAWLNGISNPSPEKSCAISSAQLSKRLRDSADTMYYKTVENE